MDEIIADFDLIMSKYENSKAYSEVYDIINHMDEETYNSVPKKFIDYIKINRDFDYKVDINYDKDLYTQINIETARILSIMYENIYLKENYDSSELFEKNQKNKEEKKNASSANLDTENMKISNIEINKNNQLLVIDENGLLKNIINRLKNIINKLKNKITKQNRK